MKTFKYAFILLFCLLIIFVKPHSIFAESNDYIVINIPSRTLELIKNGSVYKTYPVGVGKSGFPTPIGDFKVISKVVNPAWEHPYEPIGKIRISEGKTSPLGTRWMGFWQAYGGVYGIHGTYKKDSVGKFSSHGCVRMYNKDVEELFKLVNLGMPVKVTYDLVKDHSFKGDKILNRYPDVYKSYKITSKPSED